MSVQMQFNTREFERALREVSNESDRSDAEIITMNARTLLKSVVYNSPRDTGTLRAAYWPAWTALQMGGSPGTRRSYRPWKTKAGREYNPQGNVEDKRRQRGEKSFLFTNRTYFVNKQGRRVAYPYILNQRDNFMAQAEGEASFKFGRAYERALRKHSKL